MRAALLVALAALSMLMVPAASADAWLQPRGDAAATGFHAQQGPAWKDVALEVELPQLDNAGEAPLILEDRVIVSGDQEGSEQLLVLSVDLTTAEVETLARLDPTSGVWSTWESIASDGETLFVVYGRAVHAIPLTDAGETWTWEWDPRIPEAASSPTSSRGPQLECFRIAVESGHVTVLCNERDWLWEEAGDAGIGAWTERSFVARLDKADGSPAWTWEHPSPDAEPGTQASGSRALGMAIGGSHVVVGTTDWNGTRPTGVWADELYGQPEAWAARAGVWVLDADSGDVTWSWSTPSEEKACVWALPVADEECVADHTLSVGGPVVDEGAVYAKADGAHKFNIGTGERLWTRPIGTEDVDPTVGGGTSFALAEGQLYTATSQTVYKMGADQPETGWSTRPELPEDQGFRWAEPVVTPSAVYVASGWWSESGPLYALDVDTGDVLWGVEAAPTELALGDGKLVYVHHGWEESPYDFASYTPSLVVLGRTEASPEPVAEPTTAYPAPGQEVGVDLSSSEPGLQGPVTRYKAIWGDGNETAWQTEPLLTHTYTEPGDVQTRFIVGNDANQTASTTQTFHVGQQAPTEPNWLSERFAPENQDMTFGVLGIALALGGGVIGVSRQYRKRSRLQGELEALEEGFEATRGRPGECEALLDNRRARARSLALDGKLDEEQVAIVEARAEELRRELRTVALEEEFSFLPYGLVTKAREMVEDGHVTSLEREAFLAALEENRMLTDEQKGIVRERIEAWHGRDASGGGAA